MHCISITSPISSLRTEFSVVYLLRSFDSILDSFIVYHALWTFYNLGESTTILIYSDGLRFMTTLLGSYYILLFYSSLTKVGNRFYLVTGTLNFKFIFFYLNYKQGF